jgi:hypothetical protein
LLGACAEAVGWVDTQEHGDLDKLFNSAREDFQEWLTSRLGGTPTPERLMHAFDFRMAQ